MAPSLSLRQLEAGLTPTSAHPTLFHRGASWQAWLPSRRRAFHTIFLLTIIICSLLYVKCTPHRSQPRSQQPLRALPSLISPLLSIPPHYAAPDFPIPITKDVPPLSCHSHNDYWRQYPLLSGLRAGCISTEADVWAFPGAPLGHLYVGHIRASLVPARTLKNMYIDPLLKMLEDANRDPEVAPSDGEKGEPEEDEVEWVGVFDTRPLESFTLMIDFKTTSELTFPSVLEALQPLHAGGWLTHVSASGFIVPRPLTIVLTGETSFATLLNIPLEGRFVFFDAPLGALPPPSTQVGASGSALHMYNATNSYYASTPLQPLLDKAGSKGTDLAEESAARAMVRGQIQAAKEAGLRPRYWDTPAWPVGVRNTVWKDLWALGVAVLNVDDLHAVRAFWDV
ncbi:MAG: Altered inheritance of mitochondria protein 6 [Vezdaea aestivalis]|nr:MAG: Altered inheritance of mitochondria protein 6 [Vezdaea aestivalis]